MIPYVIQNFIDLSLIILRYKLHNIKLYHYPIVINTYSKSIIRLNLLY